MIPAGTAERTLTPGRVKILSILAKLPEHATISHIELADQIGYKMGYATGGGPSGGGWKAKTQLLQLERERRVRRTLADFASQERFAITSKGKADLEQHERRGMF